MPLRKKIVVCIDAHPKTSLLLRNAANKAKEKDLSWVVLYVETPNHYVEDRESHERLLRFLTLAEDMGADVRQVESGDAISGITAFVREMNKSATPVASLILGQSAKEGFFAEMRASLAERVTRELRTLPLEVQIIPLTGRQYTASWFDRFQLREVKLREIGFALLSVVLAYIASEILRSSVAHIEWRVNVQNVTAFFLIACVITSLRYGLIPGLISAILGFSTINYFYISPLRGFGIAHAAEAVGLFIFLLSAVVVSLMGAYSRATNAALVKKERRSQALYKIHRLASNAQNREQAFAILYEELAQLLEMDVVFFMPQAMNQGALDLAYPAEVDFSEKDYKSLQMCWEEVRTTGLGSVNGFDASWRFEPMMTNNNEIGVMGIKVPLHMRLDPSFGRLISALADQAASLLERLEMAKMVGESHVREEREKLRAMLLSSVSHDLKTPLASIIGSLSVYNRMKKSGRLDEETSVELVNTALEEAQRLDSFISNILDMTRIESGDITFDEEWIDAGEPLRKVEKRLRQRLSQNALVVDTSDKHIEVLMDHMMIEQVLQNVIDNAVKYSPKGTDIIVSYGFLDEGFAYKIRDNGPGIPDDKLEAIFDKYERLKQSDSQVAGTGLGLAISRAVLEKQNGTITAMNHPDGGAEFTLWLPQAREQQSKRSDVA
jgi:two-component system sensor histidine kinase KdpD